MNTSSPMPPPRAQTPGAPPVGILRGAPYTPELAYSAAPMSQPPATPARAANGAPSPYYSPCHYGHGVTDGDSGAMSPHVRAASGVQPRSRTNTAYSTVVEDSAYLRSAASKPMRLIQLSDLVKATRDFRAALHAVASKGEMLNRVLQGIATCRAPDEEDPIPYDLMADVDFLADTLKLVSGTHQLLGDMVWRDLETPLNRDLDSLNNEALSTCTQHNNRLAELRPRAIKAAQRVAKIRAKYKRADEDKLVEAVAEHEQLHQQITYLDRELQTYGDRLAAPRLHGVVRSVGPIAQGLVGGYTNLTSAVHAMAAVGHRSAWSARDASSRIDHIRRASAAPSTFETATAGEYHYHHHGDGDDATLHHRRASTSATMVVPPPPLMYYPQEPVPPRTQSQMAMHHQRAVSSASAYTMATAVEGGDTGGGAVSKSHVRASIFSMLSTDLGSALVPPVPPLPQFAMNGGMVKSQ
ncbi:hypothetical protein H9P43_003151 [Blastocladiella emersonii ATCC 22665]|nr:hypothetical protein H9P43_003151 [Blastocladiella emersonii ATCC 22665]